MARLIEKRTKSIGMPPGTLVHIGEKKEEEITLRRTRTSRVYRTIGAIWESPRLFLNREDQGRSSISVWARSS